MASLRTNKHAFWFHYNKPESRRLGKPQITVHYKGTCHIVDNVHCNASTQGRIRKSQPFWVMAGKAESIKIENNIAIIN